MLIDALDPALPPRTVRVPSILVQPIASPSISAAVSLTSRDTTLDADSTLVITGWNLKSDSTELLFGGNPSSVALQPDEITSNSQLEVKLSRVIDAIKLHAGPKTVQVVQPLMDDQHPGVVFESNVQTFVLRPLLNDPGSLTASGASPVLLTAKLRPNVGAAQRVVLLLNATAAGANPAAYTIDADPNRADDVDSVRFTLTNVKAGTYAVRVQVDGADALHGGFQNRKHHRANDHNLMTEAHENFATEENLRQLRMVIAGVANRLREMCPQKYLFEPPPAKPVASPTKMPARRHWWSAKEPAAVDVPVEAAAPVDHRGKRPHWTRALLP